MSNGTTTASGSSPRESQTDSSQAPRSLAMCVSSHSPVPLSNTEDLRTWLQQASHASHSALPESSAEQTTSAICGRPQGTLFSSLDLDSFSWKTQQTSLFQNILESSSPTWPKWGIASNGECLELTPAAFHIIEPDYGWLPTPRASMATHGICWARANSRHKGNIEDFLAQKYLQTGGKRVKGLSVSASFVTLLMGWPQMWASLNPLATARFQEWLQQHGDF